MATDSAQYRARKPEYEIRGTNPEGGTFRQLTTESEADDTLLALQQAGATDLSLWVNCCIGEAY